MTSGNSAAARVTRRTVLAAATAWPVRSAFAAPCRTLPFLWGAASSGYQVEGDERAADIRILERVPSTLFREPAGLADDHYRRYREDIALLAWLGFNSFRFSLEWARIEPEKGVISRDALAHYRDVLRCCHEHDLVPCVTYSHFANPAWFAAEGGWEARDAVDRFLRYCDVTSRALGDLIGIAATFNEPDLHKLLLWGRPGEPAGKQAMLSEAARQCGSDRFGYYLSGDPQRVEDRMIAAHRRAIGVIRSGPGQYPLGVTLAMTDDQAVGPPGRRDEKRRYVYENWLVAARESADFVGVQVYTRNLIGPAGIVPTSASSEKTAMGWEFYPDCVEGACRYAASVARLPVVVTENGIATDDDAQRQHYIRSAVAALERARRDGVDIRGYYHWSFLDSYEWSAGYAPHMGLVSVNRAMQARVPKPSAALLAGLKLPGSVCWKLVR
ncbi:glycoside hydrolase family 1 protein [Gluconacetobacter sacchari]|uniref:beta-glucosidase n=1 Tax=Gluconacetobacter sacchari TaxID=92759 RepID=A0A7W4NQ66_9PROT|nr:family 1 glycosylhydrolase [Gluconacetobacter sacchari]MBB2162239.1 family 1 glycosylhydrolase [Gluconacetobacter sacchari]